MKIDKNLVALAGVAGTFLCLFFILGVMAFVKVANPDFISMGEIVAGIAVQIYNASSVEASPSPSTEAN
jgi:hypothetical protein